MSSWLRRLWKPSSEEAAPCLIGEETETQCSAPAPSDENSLFKGVVYKIEGQDVELFRPSSCILALVDDGLCILDEEHHQVDVKWDAHSILSVRQYRPMTLQFLHRGIPTNSKSMTEYGIHFSESSDALKCRAGVLERIADTLDVDLIHDFHCTVEIMNPESQEFIVWLENGSISIRRRTLDQLAMLTLANELGDLLFQTELTNDIQLWMDIEKEEFSIWGPFFEWEGKEFIRLLLKISFPPDAAGLGGSGAELLEHHDAVIDMFRVLQLSVGFESKLIPDDSANEYAYDGDSSASSSPTSEVIRWSDETSDSDATNNNQKRHRRTSISYDPSGKIVQEDPGAKLHRFMQVGENVNIVCRSTASAEDCYWNRSRNGAATTGDKFNLHVSCNGGTESIINSDQFGYKDKVVIPYQGILNDGESKLLFADQGQDSEKIYQMDLEREKVIAEYDTRGYSADVMWNSFKGGANSHDPTFLCANKQAFFMMDTRAAGKNSRSYTKPYASRMNFTAGASDENGHIVLGNQGGEFRLYDGQKSGSNCEEFKIAKTQLDSFKDCIKAVDVTKSGSWILGTMKTCLVLFPVKLKSSGLTGFETRLGKFKPPPVKLTLNQQDIIYWNLEDLDFRPAVFDEANDTIITSTGNLAVLWNFKSIRKGNTHHYSIKKMGDYIKEAKPMINGSIAIAHPTDIKIVNPKRSTLLDLPSQ